MADKEETVDEESFEELAKRAESAEDDSDDDGSADVVDIPVDDKGERLSDKVKPMQANEFTCRKCFLVKHRSQIANKSKLYCVDCA